MQNTMKEGLMLSLDYDKEIIATIGSKEGLANMAQVSGI